MRWLGGITDLVDMSLSKLWEFCGGWEAWCTAVHAVTESDMPEQLNWTEKTAFPFMSLQWTHPSKPLSFCSSSCSCPVMPSLPHLSLTLAWGVPYLQPWWRQAAWTLLLFPVLQYSFYFMLNHQVDLLQCFLFNAVTGNQLVYDFQICVL